MNVDPLITCSLLGSARMATLPAAPTPELQTIWQAIERETENPAAAILQALALTRALHFAGTQATLDAETIAVCPDESQPFISAGAVQAGRRMLDGEYQELMPEWFQQCIDTGAVVPHRLLPALLNHATRHPQLREATREICGQRGYWLARRHPAFAWVLEAAPVDDDAWDSELPAERLAWLRQTRVADPQKARAAILAQWDGETPAMRQAIVQLIAARPAPDDEDFLESHALLDRRQEVREPALAGLLQIPGSRLLQRACGRLGQHVHIQRRLFRRFISITPPAAFQPEWTADGIKAKPPQGTGEKAWWLRQVAAMVPLAAWPALLQVQPDELFTLSLDDEWAETLVLGWIDAAQRVPSLGLATHALPFFAGLDPWPKPAPVRTQVLAALLDQLPVAQQYALLESIHDLAAPAVMLDLLCRMTQAPAPGTAPKSLRLVRSAIQQARFAMTRPQARALARCVPVAAIQAELMSLAALPEINSAAEEFAATLEFRKLICQESNPPPHPP